MSHLKYALRTLGRSPGFTVMAVLTLAISIGANTTVFSLLDTLLWRPLDVKDSDRLVVLLNRDENGATRAFSREMLTRLRERQQAFDDLVGWFAPSATVDWGGEAERVGALQLTGNTFAAMGIRPYLGRGLTPQDDHPNAAPVAVLTHHYWERRFGKDASVVGRTALIADRPVTVVGVSAPGFAGFQPGLPCEILTPLSVRYWSDMPWDDPTFLWVQVFGHLKPGISAEQAKAQLDVVWPQIRAEVMPAEQSAAPRRDALANSVTVEPATAGRTFLRGRFEEPLQVLMAVVGLMLLIACVNIAALLLVRTVGRYKEAAVRVALGAGRWRVASQLLTESLLVVVAGASLGLLLTSWGADLIVATLARGPARYYFDTGVDFRVLAFSVVLAAMTAVLFSIVPAFRMSRVDPAGAMRKSSSAISGGRSPLISLLVCVELALSLVMLVGAGLFVQSLSNLRGMPLAFNPNNVLLLYMEPLEGGYGDANLGAYYGDLLRRVKGLPGVADAGLGRSAPASYFPQGSISVKGPSDGDREASVFYTGISQGYFDTMGTNLIRGRNIELSDAEESPGVAIINETLARDFFGSEDPLGKRVAFKNQPDRDLEIVGVVRDTGYRGYRRSDSPAIYTSVLQNARASGFLTLAVRTQGDPLLLVGPVRRVAAQLGVERPVSISTLESRLDSSVVHERLIAWLSSVFAIAAVLLACIGLYGIMSYTVEQRTKEIGIRMALGAGRWGVVRLVLRHVLVMAAAGVIVGVPASIASLRIASSLLFGLAPTDWRTIAGAAVILTVVAGLAGFLPARRAARLDPTEALRWE